MELLVRNAEGNLSQPEKDYAARKLGRLDRYFSQAQKVELVHRQDKSRHHIDITVFADGFIVRGAEEDVDIRTAIDRVADKLENRLRKLKGRLIKNHRKRGAPMPNHWEDHVEEEDEHRVEIAERVTYLLKPMPYDEAALQMDLMDQPFLVFRNAETMNVEVLFRRKDGRYGLLQPEG